MGKGRIRKAGPGQPASQHQRDVAAIGAIIDMPEAQRQPAEVRVVPVDQIGKAARSTPRTLRRLTSIEKLRNSGVLTAHEAITCEWYAERYSLAFEVGHGGTANYGFCAGRGGSGSMQDKLMSRFRRQAEAREDYAWARSFLPADYAALFENVICHGAKLGQAGQQLWGALSTTGISTRMRSALKLCANHLHLGVGHRLNIAPAPAPAEPLPGAGPSSLEPIIVPGRPVSEAVDEALGRAEAEGATGLLLAPSVLAALKRENAASGMATYRGVELIVQEHWHWGWIVRKPTA